MATLNKVGEKYWQINWVDPVKGRQRKNIGRIGVLTEREAMKFLAEFERGNSKVVQVLGGAPNRSMTLAQYVPTYLRRFAQRFPASVVRTTGIMELLLPHFGHFQMDQIPTEKYWDYMARRTATGVKPATIQREISTFKSLLNYACRGTDKVITQHTLQADIRAPQNLDKGYVKYYTPEQLAKIYVASGQKERGRSMGAVWRFMANTGLRRSEMLALLVSNITDSHVRVVSTAAQRTKSGKARQIPLSAGAREALEILLPQVAPGQSTLIGDIGADTFGHIFQDDAKRAGVGGHMHMLRHTFAATLATNGVPLLRIQKWMGHASITTTEIYAHLIPGDDAPLLLGLSL